MPITVAEDTPLEEAVRLMERHRIKRLPVVRAGELVGIVTPTNIMHALVSLAVQTKPMEMTQPSAKQILAECARQERESRFQCISISYRPPKHKP
jgi:CBS-domain-containing membrane protein